MKKAARHILIAVSFPVAALTVAMLICDYISNRRETEACRQYFPDGEHTLVISHVGEPIFPYGEDRMKITVLEGKKAVYDTLVNVKNDGARGRFGVEWKDGHPIVTLSGDEMDDVTVWIP